LKYVPNRSRTRCDGTSTSGGNARCGRRRRSDLREGPYLPEGRSGNRSGRDPRENAPAATAPIGGHHPVPGSSTWVPAFGRLQYSVSTHRLEHRMRDSEPQRRPSVFREATCDWTTTSLVAPRLKVRRKSLEPVWCACLSFSDGSLLFYSLALTQPARRHSSITRKPESVERVGPDSVLHPLSFITSFHSSAAVMAVFFAGGARRERGKRRVHWIPPASWNAG
jgi:hypothetical protein